MSDFDESFLSTDEENLTFSKEQIEYLRDEFERQRRWINLLSTREKLALEELEQTQNSISYRFGRGEILIVTQKSYSIKCWIVENIH